MLISKSGPITGGFSLLTCGDTCIYYVGLPDTGALFDTGAGVHTTGLIERLKSYDLSLNDVDYIFITNLQADRIGGLPYLKKANPKLVVVGTASMKKKLSDPDYRRSLYREDQLINSMYPSVEPPKGLDEEEYCSLLSLDRVCPINETIPLDFEVSVRLYGAPGHTSESLAYLILPLDILVTDLGFGYFRGKSLATPGGDADLNKALASLVTFKDIEFSALCLPLYGVITGTQVKRHIENVIQNTNDLTKECHNALIAGVKEEDILASLDEWFFVSLSEDPIINYTMNRTKKALWKQIKEAHTEESPTSSD